MVEWNKYEIDVAKEIINIGLSKAADSLSFFIHKKVLLQGLNLEVKPIEQLEYPKEGDDIIFHVLTSEIKGDIQGYCYLNFSEDDGSKFLNIALPDGVKNDEDKYKEMGKAMLLEVDNIITASVVTQFANLLKVSMHGFVPIYKMLHASQILEYMYTSSKEATSYLHFRAKFMCKEVNMAPDFIWLLDREFMKKVSSFIKEEKNILGRMENMIEVK